MAEAIKVTAAAVVLPTVDGRESYFYRGAVLPVHGFTEAGLEHARGAGLIEDHVVVEVDEEETPVTFSQADVDAAVKAAEDAKDDELAEARKLVEEKAIEVAAERDALAAEKSAVAKAPAPAKAPAAKQG